MAKAKTKQTNPNVRRTAMDPLVLRALREKAELSQDQFAQLIGVARSTYNRWEAGLTTINPVHASAIHAALRKHADGASPDAA